MSNLPLRVLVLEDHSFQRSVAVSMLRQLKCREVFEAADGAEALQVLQIEGPVDIVLCDLQMEGMDGLEFIRRASQSGFVKSIIISSSLPADLCRAVQQIISLLGLQLLGDIGKPLKQEVLGALLKKHLKDSKKQFTAEAIFDLASEAEVHHALAQHQLKAYYQPKFNLATGKLFGVEILTRWQHPLKGTLSPTVFMSVLERCGLMDELLFGQLHQALRVHQRARDIGITLNMAFNLLASQLVNAELISRIKTVLAHHQVSGSHLTFELTESGLLETPVTSLETLFRLRMMGCRLSIDDFGAGFSSLLRLCQLPFNEIKVDAEFVRMLKQEPRSQAVISSTLALADTLGMSVVVEGIETQEQCDELIRLGCSLGQGYWYARPMSGPELLRWLRSTYLK